MNKLVLIVGGYGVFGARIARALAREPGLDLVVAGRDGNAAAAHCARWGGRPLALDRAAPGLDQVLAGLAPFLIIDAAGPFQGAAPQLARAAIAAGAHYLDLSDDAAFTAAIGQWDEAAKARGVAVLSGVSSVPALSSAAVAALAEGMADLHLIETVILPGNRAPRGLSVVRAIVGQVGRPLAEWRAGRWVSAPAWGDLRRLDLSVPGQAALGRRWASRIGAPDLLLFPARFRARTVAFAAGLELTVMHLGLWLLGWPVRLGLAAGLAPLAPLLRALADRLHRFGSDRGGMRVRVAGLTETGQAVTRDWTLIAEAGDGPEVPGLPARILCSLLQAGAVAPGARPCLAEFSLAAAETAMAAHAITSHRRDAPQPLLFRQALGEAFDRLPPVLRDLHTVIAERRWCGRAQVERGTGLLSRLAARLLGLPPAAADVAVEVLMTRRGDHEIWRRDFGGKRFRSVLGPGRPVVERFGLLRFTLNLLAGDGALHFPVGAGRVLGLPLPRALLPVSETAETVDDQGRACFDVAIRLPLAGFVIRYRGWLRPADD
ncbi:SDR family oxidoreductase [Zavarzinia compransoris]|uniref:Saccharopine dehydrogenase n=1 Tax=Zavarzinia compransoris TaxID=1264899 RepID=A0A317E0G6_9PROT|nr:SDR family oxidoreductase [Zavarzinia compransoris]PWR20548.1 saccharopine dehydrogenase [Zavarzinia compransoris]TDP43806.1 saccharopine dehydrogenase-like NADP-dependent oxidoreductase [Zavarzinia compransoris]